MLSFSLIGMLAAAILVAALSASPIKVIQRAEAETSYTFCVSGCQYSNLQAAIDSLPSTGGTIYIKDGIYELSNTVLLKSNTKLVFSSGAYITFTGGEKPIFKGYGVNNVSIKGGSITAKYQGGKAIVFMKSQNIVVDGTKIVLVQGRYSSAFFCMDCVDVYVSNINAKYGTRLIDIKTSTRDASSGLTRNVWIKDNVLAYSAVEAIKVNWCKDVHIIGNQVSNTQNNGIDIGFNINSEVKYNSLYKTGMNNAAGIHTDNTRSAVISNNKIDITGSTAIPVYGTKDVQVLSNTIKHAGKAAISIIDSEDTNSYIKVKSNYVYAPKENGIYQSANQDHVEIAYNTLENIPSGYKAIKIIWSDNGTTSVHDNTVL